MNMSSMFIRIIGALVKNISKTGRNGVYNNTFGKSIMKGGVYHNFDQWYYL